MGKTLRLAFPEWQGGANENYVYGSKLLTWLAPKGKASETIEVPVDMGFDKELVVQDQVTAKDILLKQQTAAYEILNIKKPDKVITFGGACSVEQAPVDYLHGLYPKAGLLWIDAHPDFSEPGDYPNEHAMVLGNLLGGGAPDFARLVQNPFASKDVMFVGLVADGLESYEKKHMEQYQISYAAPQDLTDSNEKVIDWIKQNGYEQLIIHFDLDVLSGKDFGSLLSTEPYLGPVSYTTGQMKLEQIEQLIQEISEQAVIVGLGITEYMPWDAIRLRKAMEKMNIFND